MKKVFFSLVFVFSISGAAQVATPPPVSSPAPLAGAVTAVGKATNAVPSSVPSPILMLLGLLASSEVVMRAVPTKKALSWFLAIGALISAVILLLQKVQVLMTTIGNSLQNTSPPTSS